MPVLSENKRGSPIDMVRGRQGRTMGVARTNSRWPGFHQRGINERTDILMNEGLWSEDDVARTRTDVRELLEGADARLENVVGIHPLPLAVATNFRINGQDVFIPMAVEEPSVVAAASHAAKMVRESGGFKAASTAHLVAGQVQLVACPDWSAAEAKIRAAEKRLLALASDAHPSLVRRGGGPRELRVTQRGRGSDCRSEPSMLIVEMLVDTCDAMGANLINTMMEHLAPVLEALSGGQAVCRIVSNYATECLGRAYCTVSPDALQGEGHAGAFVRDRIVLAHEFAVADIGRAVTHNKGIMNGVDATVVATGNDWRAIEAGCHAYAARSGQYRPLSEWHVDEAGQLVGSLELPLPLGTVGASISAQPTAVAALHLLQNPTARRLIEIVAAVGLAQNLAALWALTTEGIQRGHMRLHARSVELAAGSRGGALGDAAQPAGLGQ